MGYILIIGEATEVNKALAHRYARSGYNIVFAGKDVKALESVVQDIEFSYGREAKALKFDPVEFYSGKSFYKSLDPKPEGVILAVDYQGDSEKIDSSYIEIKKVIDCNYTGCVSILNAIASDFEKRRQGFIVGVCSIHPSHEAENNYLYLSAKKGFYEYLKGIKNKLSEYNIQVMCVKPNGFFYEFFFKNGFELKNDPQKVARGIFEAQQKGKDEYNPNWIKESFKNLFEPVKNLAPQEK